MAVIWAVTGAGPRRRTARRQHWLFPGKLTCPSHGMRLTKPVRRRRPTQPYFQAHHTRFVSASVRCPYAGKRNRRPHDSIADGALVRVVGSSGHSVISKLNLTSFMGRPNIGHFTQKELTL